MLAFSSCSCSIGGTLALSPLLSIAGKGYKRSYRILSQGSRILADLGLVRQSTQGFAFESILAVLGQCSRILAVLGLARQLAQGVAFIWSKHPSFLPFHFREWWRFIAQQNLTKSKWCLSISIHKNSVKL